MNNQRMHLSTWRVIRASACALSLALVLACGGPTPESTTEEPATAGTSAKAPAQKQATVASSEDTYLRMKIADGPLQGTHHFSREEGTRGWVALSLEQDGYSNLNGSQLISDDGELKIEYLNRLIAGEIEAGSLPAHLVDDQCGSMSLQPKAEVDGHQKIRADHVGCQPADIMMVSDWKVSSPYQRRGVAGQYSDRLRFEMIDGSIVESDVEVEFLAVERRLAQ